MKSKSARARLLSAMATQSFVDVERKPKYADRLSGSVLQVGSKWALMAQFVDGGYFDGLVAFRLHDVKRVTEDDSVAVAFSKTRPEWPPSYDRKLDLATTSGVISGMSRGGGLMGIQKEQERSATWIGTLEEVRGRFVYLHEVRPDATWHAAPLGYRLRAITSVEMGRRYYAALSAIAGDGPPREHTAPGTASR